MVVQKMKTNRENSTKETGDTKEGNDTMSATARNFVYEISAKDTKKVLAQPAASKKFLDDCKKVAEKYRKKG